MFAPAPRRTRPSYPVARFVRRALLLPLILALLAGVLAAQTEREMKRAAAERLFDEGVKLRDEGTKESLEAGVLRFAEALSLYRALGDAPDEASTLVNLGFVYDSLNEKQKALDYYAQALSLFRAAGDRRGEATALNNIGRVYSSLGEKQKALDYYAQSVPLLRAAGERRHEAAALNNIAKVYDALDEKQKALEYYEQTLPPLRALGDRRGEAVSLNVIGLIYDALGEKQKALDHYAQALPLRRAAGDRRGEAVTLNGIGAVYSSLGEKQRALDYYAQALPLRRAAGDRDGEATTLNNIGGVYSSLGEKQKALDHYAQALPLRRAGKDRDGEAVTLANIGSIYAALGERQKALDHYAQALLILHAAGVRDREAVALNNIGGVYAALGEGQKALDHFAQALTLSRAVGDRRNEAVTLFNIAHLERNRGNLREALTRIEAALDLVESLRTKIADQELRASFFATVQGYYEFYVDLLMRLHRQQPSAGYDGKALQASERGRARSLLEILAEAGADIRQGVDSKLVERERSLQRQLNAGARRQMQLLGGRHTEEQAVAVAGEIEALKTELQQVEAQIRQASPRYAALTQPQPLSLKEIQTQVLDADTLLLEYSLGAGRSYLWAVTPDSITSYELPKREEVEAAARQFYELLAARPAPAADAAPGASGLGGGLQLQDAAQLAQSAAQLSRMLLAPVAAQLGKKRLLVVGDGALQYIPFGALPAPTGGAGTSSATPLVVEHEIVNLPSASTLAVLRREAGAHPTAAAKTLAVLADPVFEKGDERLKARAGEAAAPGTMPAARGDESRGLGLVVAASAKQSGVAGAGLSIPRLPGTRREADAIVKLVPPASYKEALDFEASRATATDPDLSQYRYVHFATHGFLNSRNPELSGVIFSMFDERGAPQDGFLRAHEVFNLKLAAEVVVLSACQTGLGKEVRGEGLVSLTRGFMYAGAPRVVVSLWDVDDEATAELMVRFYRGMLAGKLRPARALQAAQVSMLKERRFAPPYFWAAFTLQGEWR